MSEEIGLFCHPEKKKERPSTAVSGQRGSGCGGEDLKEAGQEQNHVSEED